MRALLIDIDSKIPNLALMKASAYHKSCGDTVGFDISEPDKVYISCIFTKNAAQARGAAMFYPDAEIDIGGSGISLSKVLPSEIEAMKPDYDLYQSTYSQGFTTRGCIRKCPFCIVPEKEGMIREAQHPSEFHDDRFDTCMIMDNNLFAAPQSWQDDVLRWFIDNKVKMLSQQGWDIRLLNDRRADLLKKIKHVNGLHFAWDNMKDEDVVLKGISLLKEKGFDLRNRVQFYVLAGFNGSGFDDAFYRCNRLKELGTMAFVMPYHKNDKEINCLARWSNWKQAYWGTTYQQFKEAKL
jgi:hypothetical protein